MKMMTRNELAEALEIHTETVSKWVAAGMPVAVRGRRGHAHQYRESAVRSWLAERDTGSSESRAELTAARARKELALADVNELKAGMMRGELLSRHEIDRVWRAENSAVRAMLLSWPTTISDAAYQAAISDGLPGVEREHGRAVREVLAELSDADRPIPCLHCGANLAELPEPSGDEVRCCAATTKSGKRCGNPAGADGFCRIDSHGASA